MMWTSPLVVALLGVASAKSIAQPVAPQQIFSTLPNVHDGTFPSVRESSAMARKILHLSTIGNLATVFPSTKSDDSPSTEYLPEGIGGSPIGLLEYYADCDPLSGNPILLGINIATPFRNYAAGSNISLSVRWWPTQKNTYSFFSAENPEIPTPHTPAALPRFSLHGRLEPVSEEKLKSKQIAECFLRAHPDSIYWQPGNDVHTSHYVQLIVEHVYWFGGFGDRARIQWLPIDTWRSLTMEEIIAVKLPGEKSTKSWWSKTWL